MAPRSLTRVMLVCQVGSRENKAEDRAMIEEGGQEEGRWRAGEQLIGGRAGSSIPVSTPGRRRVGDDRRSGYSAGKPRLRCHGRPERAGSERSAAYDDGRE